MCSIEAHIYWINSSTRIEKSHVALPEQIMWLHNWFRDVKTVQCNRLIWYDYLPELSHAIPKYQASASDPKTTWGLWQRFICELWRASHLLYRKKEPQWLPLTWLTRSICIGTLCNFLQKWRFCSIEHMEWTHGAPSCARYSSRF